MPKPSWSYLGALLVAVLFQASVEVHGWCLQANNCRDGKAEDGLVECIKSCKMDLSAESPVFPGNGQYEPLSENIRKYVMSHFRWNKFGRRNISSGSISSDGGNVGQKRQELMQGDFLDLPPPGVWGEDEEMQGEGLPLSRKARELQNKRSYSMEHFRWGKPVGKKRRPVKIYPNGVEEESAESYPVEIRRDLPMKIDFPEVPELAIDEEEAAKEVYEEKVKKDGGGYKMEHFRWGTPPKDKRYGGFMVSEKSHTPLMTLFKNAIIKNGYKKGQ